MKFCQKCGAQVRDEAVVCTNCGCAVTGNNTSAMATGGNDGLAVAAKVFLILGCILQGWMLIPLAWCLPITISVCNKMKRNEPVGIGLKICALLFVSLLGGIFLLCRNDD